MAEFIIIYFCLKSVECVTCAFVFWREPLWSFFGMEILHFEHFIRFCPRVGLVYFSNNSRLSIFNIFASGIPLYSALNCSTNRLHENDVSTTLTKMIFSGEITFEFLLIVKWSRWLRYKSHLTTLSSTITHPKAKNVEQYISFHFIRSSCTVCHTPSTATVYQKVNWFVMHHILCMNKSCTRFWKCDAYKSQCNTFSHGRLRRFKI